jgi:hypothetical protein
LGQQLTPQELDDLIAFLESRKREVHPQALAKGGSAASP